jgi:DNA-binding response OmpR family regulator
MFTAMKGKLYEIASFNAGANDFILKTTLIPNFVFRLYAHIDKYDRNKTAEPSPQ